MLLGLIIYGYATGVFSSRSLERATHDSVAFRFIAANEHPDHDTIAPARIASPEMLPSVGLLPHVICSPPGFGGGEHEADQHGDTG